MSIVEAVIARAVIGIGSKAVTWVCRYLVRDNERPGERHRLLRDLFLGEGEHLLCAARDWRPAAGQEQPPASLSGYPHDIRALQTLIPLLPRQFVFQEKMLFAGTLRDRTHLVCAGSPKANNMLRSFLPSYVLTASGSRRLQYPTLISPHSLPYCFGENLAEQHVYVHSMMDPGKVSPKTRKMIWQREGRAPWVPRGYFGGRKHEDGRMLSADFLLVSKLPRTRNGGDILAFAGAHGAGTESLRLLMNEMPIGELRELAAALAGARYFQFVLEVPKVKHTKAGTFPTAVSVSTDLPPIRLHEQTVATSWQ